MNKALTYYSNFKAGISLEELLKDDPIIGDADQKKFKQKIKKFEKEYFEPIKLMDEYLDINGSKGDYNKVSNRWQSFEELVKYLTSQLENQQFLLLNNIEKHERGLLKSAAFNLIKLKDASEVAPDNRLLMRELPKWIKSDKKEVLKIGKVEDVGEDIKDPDERDALWQKTKANEIINIVKKLKNITQKTKEQESPLDRLKEALQKLNHDDLETSQIEYMKLTDIEEALKICNKIENINDNLKRFFFQKQKEPKKLNNKFKRFNV